MCISPCSDLWLGYRRLGSPLIKKVLQLIRSLFVFDFVFCFFSHKMTHWPSRHKCKGVLRECSHVSEWRVCMHCSCPWSRVPT